MGAASNLEVRDQKPVIKPKKSIFKVIYEQKMLFIMSTPFVIWILVFAYWPIVGTSGWVMAFQEYQPGIKFSNQVWVGLKQFSELFRDDMFYHSMVNTLAMSLLGLVFGTITAIAFAIFLNEIANIKFKKTVQTISYLPHFVSWVVAASIIGRMLSVDHGPINDILVKLHLIKEPILFMSKPELFWGMVTASDIWKEMGWNAIIYIAAIAGVDPSLYEAAAVDGANRWRKIWHITLPGIKSTIIILLIMSIGNIINIGFEKQMLLQNSITIDKAYVLDFYALKFGLNISRYSYGTAIGVFKSVIGVILVFAANKFAKTIGEGGIV